MTRPVDQLIERMDVVRPYIEGERDSGFVQYVEDQAAWARETFGGGERVKGVLDHIRKELAEVKKDPTDLSEWADIIILALDGASRQGYSGAEIVNALYLKFAKNKTRTWPDWRTADPDKAIEHVRTGE